MKYFLTIKTINLGSFELGNYKIFYSTGVAIVLQINQFIINAIRYIVKHILTLQHNIQSRVDFLVSQKPKQLFCTIPACNRMLIRIIRLRVLISSFPTVLAKWSNFSKFGWFDGSITRPYLYGIPRIPSTQKRSHRFTASVITVIYDCIILSSTLDL